MHSINFRFISRVLGMMCLLEAGVIVGILILAICLGESFLPWVGTVLAFTGIGLPLLGLGKEVKKKKQATRREGMLTVTLTWVLLSLIGMLPFLMYGATDNALDAFFETVSGFTTTGATIFEDVESLPRSLLFWRSIIQWQGGVGIVVFTVALMPIFGGGATQLYNAETTGITHDRFFPRITDVAKALWLVYLAETLVLIVLLWLGSMPLFDAVCHALTCISTGGYSTRNAGIQAFHSPYVDYVISGFMYIGSLNLTLVFFALTGKPGRLFKDEEFRFFSLFILSIGVMIAVSLYQRGQYPTIEENVRFALFQTISLGSSTGYVSMDLTHLGPFIWMLALILMFVNGCAGSTSGGLKSARFLVLLKNLYNEFKKQIHPHLLTPVLMNKRQLSVSAVHQVLAFCVMYIMLIFMGATLLLMDQNDFISSVSIACSAISNSGPGIGKYGLSVSEAGAFTKSILCFLMLAGRLEVFTVLGILTPYFWKR